METFVDHQPTPAPKAGQAPAAVPRASCWLSLQRWVLWLGFAYIAVTGWVRLAAAITGWYWLNFTKMNPGPLYLAITGGLWGLTALAALIWLVLRRPGYRLVGMSAALFFALTYWIDRLFISTHPGGTGNTPFAILLTLLLLAYVALVLRPLPALRALKRK